MSAINSDLEDRFLRPCCLAAAKLFLALTFTGVALAGGLLSSYLVASSALVESGVFAYSRAVMYQTVNVYAISMAGVFMILNVRNPSQKAVGEI